MTEQKTVFKVGDRVKWVHSGRSNWSIRTGTIEEICEGAAIVRYGKKTLFRVPLDQLNDAAAERIRRIVERFR